MGIDYRSVGGIGIEVTEQMIDEAIERKYPDFDEDSNYDEKLDNLLSETDLLYHTAGNAYSGETAFYLLVPGKTLGEVLENIPVFLEGILRVFNIKQDPADLEVISELLIY